MTISTELHPRRRPNEDAPSHLFEATYDDGPSNRIGLIVTAGDECGERAFRSLMPENVEVFTTRMVYEDADPDENGRFWLRTSFDKVVKTLPPPGRIDALAFSCNSASVAVGSNRLREMLCAARPDVQPTMAGWASVLALQALGARNVALITPYDIEWHNYFVPFLEGEGFNVVADGSFNQTEDEKIGLLSREAWFRAAEEILKTEKPDALFVSCTASNIVPHIPYIEQQIGVPVVSSAQAMAWHALKLINHPHDKKHGQLFKVV